MKQMKMKRPFNVSTFLPRRRHAKAGQRSCRAIPKQRRACRGEAKRRRVNAFTLIELLVVIAIIAILASIILPVLNQAKERSINIAALNNIRQQIIAWKMYPTDNNNFLPQNQSGDGHPSWMAGQMRGSQNGTAPSVGVAPYVGVEDYTNTALLMDPNFSLIGNLIQNPKVLLDPGDQSTWANPGGTRSGRVRSFSMNCFVGFTNVPTTWRYYHKDSDLIAPSPSDLYVLLDEHPDSINDDYFDFTMPTSPLLTHWVDMPAAYHNGACAFAFADGHTELHKWLNAWSFPLVNWNVEQTPTPISGVSKNVPGNPDILWMAAHATAPTPSAPAGTYYP